MGSLYVKMVEHSFTELPYYEPQVVDPGRLEMQSWIEAIREDKEPLVNRSKLWW